MATLEIVVGPAKVPSVIRHAGVFMVSCTCKRLHTCSKAGSPTHTHNVPSDLPLSLAFATLILQVTTRPDVDSKPLHRANNGTLRSNG